MLGTTGRWATVRTFVLMSSPGFKTPSEAIKGDYVDKKCPFTGNVSIRGRIFKLDFYLIL